MSDNWIILIPEGTAFVPEEARRYEARELFTTIAPEADQVEIRQHDTIAFFDCGANLERIVCPSCGSDISYDWWQDRMNDDFDNGFKLANYSTPCCNSLVTLAELKYDWPAGFARFSLEAMNPNIGRLDDNAKLQFEKALGTRLRIIYRHI